MKDYLERIEFSEMTYYRNTYKNSKRWSGEQIGGKVLIVYCEQGIGDTIQFARYFKSTGAAKVILHCPKALHRLMASMGMEVLDKDDPNLPPHDYHVLSMSLPFIIKNPMPQVYIDVPPAKIAEGASKIGICWEGSPEHAHNMERSCPLFYFKSIINPDRTLFMLQQGVQVKELIRGCDDLELFSIPIEDMYDLATLIAAMDVVISVDTAVLHLAGAMGKMTIGVLAKNYDYRWKVRNWYSNVILLYQGKQGDWIPVFAGVMMLLDKIMSNKDKIHSEEIIEQINI